MELFDYQRKAADFAAETLKKHSFVYLRMYMRTGKTPTSLTTAYDAGYRNVLFITKKNAISSIKKDLAELNLPINTEVINYESLHKITIEPDCIIIDESHKIGSFPFPCDSAKKIRELVLRTDAAVIFLSGTPTPESFSQIYHQFWVLGSKRSPIPEYNFFSFASKYVNVKDETIELKAEAEPKICELYTHASLGKINFWKEHGEWTNRDHSRKIPGLPNPASIPPGVLLHEGTKSIRRRRYREVKNYKDCDWQKLSPLVDHLFYTVSQEDAGFKNRVIEKFIVVETPPRLSALAEHIIKKQEYRANAGWYLDCETAVAKQQKLHQIFSGTVKAIKIGTEKTDNPEHEYVILSDFKIEPILNLINSGVKLAVFYNFVGEGILLKKHLNWTNDPMEFNKSEDKVYIGQFVSSREGVNVSTADALLMFNVPFSSTSYHQVLERLNIRNREKESVVWWLFGKDGIESKIYDTVRGKKSYTVSHFKKDYLSKRSSVQTKALF